MMATDVAVEFLVKVLPTTYPLTSQEPSSSHSSEPISTTALSSSSPCAATNNNNNNDTGSPHLNPVFDKPFIILTYAQSLDGFIALPGPKPVLLSGSESMHLTHSIRAITDGIVVGVGTVVADDPMLNVRLVERGGVKVGVGRGLRRRKKKTLEGKEELNDDDGDDDESGMWSCGDLEDSPRPVILDTGLRTPLKSRILVRHPILVCLDTLLETSHGLSRKVELEKAGATILPAPAQVDSNGSSSSSSNIRPCLRTAFHILKTRFGIRSLMIEGGATVISSLLSSYSTQVADGGSGGDGDPDLIDRVIITIAPVWIGEGVRAVTLQNGEDVGTENGKSREGPISGMEGVVIQQFGRDVVVGGTLKKKVV
jgi:riboflavin-specific deaminase-like protein